MKTRLTREERLSMLAKKPKEAKQWIMDNIWPTVDWYEHDWTDRDVVDVCKQKRKLKKLDDWLQCNDALAPDKVFMT